MWGYVLYVNMDFFSPHAIIIHSNMSSIWKISFNWKKPVQNAEYGQIRTLGGTSAPNWNTKKLNLISIILPPYSSTLLETGSVIFWFGEFLSPLPTRLL